MRTPNSELRIRMLLLLASHRGPATRIRSQVRHLAAPLGSMSSSRRSSSAPSSAPGSAQGSAQGNCGGTRSSGTGITVAISQPPPGYGR